LAADPRPSQSKQLTISTGEQEIRRLRLDNWRIIYTIRESELQIGIIAVRQRPPYDYGDLQSLLEE
jgi:mRNA interferase RelE/StbE